MGALTLLITGAAGYVGRHTVAAARARGHAVIAVVRDAATAPKGWRDDAGITVLEGDLTDLAALPAACARADVVLHLAASLSGDAARQARDTIQATQALLVALPEGAKLVHLSSMAVYDMATAETGEMIGESVPLLDADAKADAYASHKAAQEQLVATTAETQGHRLTILRAGAVFGPDRLWNAHLGFAVGPVLLRLAGRGEIPLCHISTCTAALLAAALRPATGPINLLDEDLPDRRRYLGCLAGKPPLVLPLNWRWLMPLARLATAVAPRQRLPGLLRPEVLRARFLPVSYDNSRMREVLGLRQAQSFEALMHEAQA
ncbi:NAD(P)-dependent oxidoreductase [Marinovum sp.]|uniref:NAD-dependent epimerase/dehydratase family protein n=1 Tax=Marinovum sp. TaxID=2024839 RepID=UPI002B268977|nr:NAD(P)-dependent oxidoreductase [Marinovum sp.]